MSHFNIVLTLITIVYGLMLRNLFAGLHRLLRAGKVVQWHWLPVLSAWYVLLILYKNFWGIASLNQAGDWNNILIFILYGHLLVLVYLLVSAVFPDSIPQEGIKLKEYYFQNSRYFWGLMGAVNLMILFTYFVRKIIFHTPLNIPNMIVNGIVILIIVLLAVSKKMWLHSIILLMFVGLLIMEILNF